jgi:subtilisin family serine protease
LKLKKILGAVLCASLVGNVMPLVPVYAAKGNGTEAAEDVEGKAGEETAGTESIEEKAVTDMSKYEDNELLVIYKDDTTQKEKKKAVKGLETQERTNVTEWCDKVVLEDSEDLEEAVETIAGNEDVLYVQPNFKYSIMSTASSAEDIAGITESELSKQWWIYNDGTFEEPESTDDSTSTIGMWPIFGGGFWSFSGNDLQNSSFWDMYFPKTTAVAGIDTNTAKAWKEFSGGGRKVKVAVIDTGIDYTHSQLKDSIWTNSGEIAGNGIDDDGNGYIDDVYGWDFYYNSNQVYVGTSKVTGRNAEDEDEHGTHVAGIIAAALDGTGTAGIASNTDVELMCLKVLGGKEGSGETEDIVKAIEYAEKQGAVICNMSFGINQTDIPFYYQDYDQAMKTAIQNSSMLFVTAAGNDGTNNDSYGVYPSSYDFDNIIAVANLDFDGTLSSYSNYGTKTVDIAAPGMYIYSTTPNETYDYMSGTSMATPMVTAACAMGYAYAQVPDVLAVRERILANTTTLSALKGKVSTAGMLNVYDAVSDLANHEYKTTTDTTGTNSTDTNGTTGTDSSTGNQTGSQTENGQNTSGTQDTAQNNTTTDQTTVNTGTVSDNTNNTTNNTNGTNTNNSTNTTTNTNTSNTSNSSNTSNTAVGTQFISGGTIYKITSSTEAAATGVIDSSSKTITVADSVLYGNTTYKVTKISAKAFYKNQSVKTAAIGKNVTVIGKSAFIGCKNLQKVTGMKSVKTIKKNAFKNCKNLKTLTLTESVTKIAKTSFSGCKNLKITAVSGSYAAKFAKKNGLQAG